MNEEGNPLGLNYNYTPTAGDVFEGVVNYLGGVARFYQKTVPQFFTGVRRGIKEEAEAPSPLTNTLNPIQAAGELTTAYSQSESKALEQVASGVESIGLPEPVAGAAALAVSPFIPGPAEAGLIMKGGTAVLGAVTINNPKVLKTTGRQLGEEIIENDPKLAKHLTERSVNMQRLENQIDRGLELQKVYRKDLNKRPEWKTAQRQVKKGRPALYSETSNVKPFTEQDPQQYGTSTKATKQVKEDWIKERVAKNLKITEKVHEHHLVTKGGTSAAFRKMEDFIKKGKAHPDDLVVMFEYAEKKGVAPGDRLSNIAMIQDTPHSELHKQVLIPAGDEFKQAQWDKILKELKTPENLMDWWVDQVDNNYVPNKNTGLIWQDLDDLIKEVRNSP
jgi:hypothetical protein